jgi:hypothetical protein
VGSTVAFKKPFYALLRILVRTVRHHKKVGEQAVLKSKTQVFLERRRPRPCGPSPFDTAQDDNG